MADAVYVYGIVPADVRIDEGNKGVGDPPGDVRVIEHGKLAALASPLATGSPLGTPEDLQAHARLLDDAAAETPVLPLRFGAVLSTEDAVRDELLAPHQDDFLAALEELEGKAEYIVKGRYDNNAILGEILAENEQAAQLRDQLRGKSEDATRQERIALGELINNAIGVKRDADTQRVVELLSNHGMQVYVREPSHEEDAVHVACLAETAQQPDLETIVGELADKWSGRVAMRLMGPLAPYDFVSTRR